MLFVTRKEYKMLLRRVFALERRMSALSVGAAQEQKKTATVSEMTTKREREYNIAETYDEWLNGERDKGNG